MVPDPATTAAELVECLHGQAEQFRSFLDLLAQQHDALVAHDAGELERIAAAQDEVIVVARRYEENRRALTARLADSRDPETESPAFLRIRELVAASDASLLDRLLETLASLQKEIERRQELNRSLIEQSLRCTEQMLPNRAHRLWHGTGHSERPHLSTGHTSPPDRPLV